MEHLLEYLHSLCTHLEMRTRQAQLHLVDQDAQQLAQALIDAGDMLVIAARVHSEVMTYIEREPIKDEVVLVRGLQKVYTDA